mmetsp:Transcript_19771/g.59879  ORF Transcript_19771/g.59879 Transcript_19771/m.59879 type:complete len:120 (-) Transcript_19771:1449-1808(-)|eukprot:CAMPEP_0118855582 /NCGR_PEP_ID=MMETSP1163-20130328/3354_1 /TAXON_ID=124430 /ORGANISM="Phaeomonas parva, Strain CCMP2877" /LENGTH=119 /DNA_ID=CAMNT_0006788495 /DNA_START=115 /DNA_END=474 /DNA_ORIENTATION=+
MRRALGRSIMRAARPPAALPTVRYSAAAFYQPLGVSRFGVMEPPTPLAAVGAQPSRSLFCLGGQGGLGATAALQQLRKATEPMDAARRECSTKRKRRKKIRKHLRKKRRKLIRMRTKKN